MLLIQSDFTFLFFFFFFSFSSFCCACALWGARAPSCRGPRAPCTCLAPAPRTSPGRVQEILGALHVLQSCCYCVGYKAQKKGGRGPYFSSLTQLTRGGGGGAAGGESRSENLGKSIRTEAVSLCHNLVKIKMRKNTRDTNIKNKV